MWIIKKAVKVFGIFLCGFIVFLMFYLALTQDGGYHKDIKIEKEQDKVFQSEEEKKLLDLKNSVVNTKPTSKLYASKCSACHGRGGEGRFDDEGTVIFPPIAAKPYDFILNRVNNYKEGKISNPLMAALLKNMKDEDLEALADEISKFEIEQ
ncbi:MAG: c-type cytochrome [Campylobacteraceae bacterium]|jgi:cytochrome c553|nr:c-type cytochrome [Campylobacteraceae bacterium]